MSLVAVIGAGYWGINHVKTYQQLLNEEKISGIVVCDTMPSRLRPYLNIKGIQTTDSVSKLEKLEDVTHVSIATPTPSHFEISKSLLECGKNILVEKPISFKSGDALALHRIAQNAHRSLMVGHVFRFHPALEKLREMINEAYFGKIIHIESNRCAYSVPRPDMGVLYALGIHEVDIASFLNKERVPRSISCWSRNYYRNYPDEIASFVLDFEENFTFSAFQSWLSPAPGKRREIILTGTKSSARIDYLIPDTIAIYDSSIDKDHVSGDYKLVEKASRVVKTENIEPLKAELLHFLSLGKTGSKNRSDALNGGRAVYLIERALQSVKEGRKIEIDTDYVYSHFNIDSK